MTREQLKERVRKLPMQPGVYMHKDKTGKVIRTITSRFGMQFYESIYQAAMSGEHPPAGRWTKQTPSMRPSSSHSQAETVRKCFFP